MRYNTNKIMQSKQTIHSILKQKKPNTAEQYIIQQNKQTKRETKQTYNNIIQYMQCIQYIQYM